MVTVSQPAAPAPIRRRAPGAGRKIGSRSHRVTMRETLIAAYADQLGGADRIGPILMADVERAVDMLLLAEAARRKAAAGRTSITEVCRIEGHADRAIRRLNILPPRKHSPTPTLRDHVAGHEGSLHDIVAKHTVGSD